MMKINKTYQGNCLNVLKGFSEKIFNTCVTSPPYWGLRDYGIENEIWDDPGNCDHYFNIKISPSRKRNKHNVKNPNSFQYKSATIKSAAFDSKETRICSKCNAWKGSFGLEPTPELYIQHLVQIFREVKRTLRDDGTLWLNLGDTYWGGKGKVRPQDNKHEIIKPKDLVGIPWMAAFALRADGWYLRQDIIWNKPNPMPESVTDRCTKSHEYIFLLTKSSKYFYDADSIKTETIGKSAIKTPDGWDTGKRSHGSFHKKGREKGIKGYKHRGKGDKKLTGNSGNYDKNGNLIGDGMANKRSVWTVTTKGYKEAHFATFPPELIIDCIKAGCPEEICEKCGQPKEKKLKKELVPTKKASKRCIIDKRDHIADPNSQGNNRQKDGHIPGLVNKTTIIGYNTCSCGSKFVPGIVLDPFHGSGTTGIVSRKLNRNYIAIELNGEYITIEDKRSYKELGMFK